MKQIISEHDLQASCVHWFRFQYNRYRNLLFAVPNGVFFNATNRNKAFAYHRKLIDEGLVSGVADLILLVPRHGFGALCIEMKTQNGRQSDKQKEWQAECEASGNKYVVCRSFDEFRNEINRYMQDKNMID